jgi:hypothetical protein
MQSADTHAEAIRGGLWDGYSILEADHSSVKK